MVVLRPTDLQHRQPDHLQPAVRAEAHHRMTTSSRPRATPEPAPSRSRSSRRPADVRQEALLLERAIGGWRGVIDSGVPTAVFVVAYVVTSQRPARLAHRRDRGRGADRDLAPHPPRAADADRRRLRRTRCSPPGSPLARRTPATSTCRACSRTWATARRSSSRSWCAGRCIGIAMGFLTGEGTVVAPRPRPAPRLRGGVVDLGGPVLRPARSCRRRCTSPGWVEVQGIVKIIMGYPLFLAAAYFTYRVLRRCSSASARRRPRPRQDGRVARAPTQV